MWREFKRKQPTKSYAGGQYRDNQNEKHPLQTILEQAQALKLDNLASSIEENLQNKTPTFIHLSCRDYLRNNSRPRKRSMGDAQQSIVKRVARRSDPVMFDFKSQCFYCEKPCIEDKKHADRKNFEIVSTINTKIYTSTLEICRGREDNYAKNIERRLLGISDFVAAEARYHSACRSSFENPLPKKSSKGRPISTDKIAAFESMCSILEDEMELFTLSEFQAKMEEQHENVYSPLMTKKKLQEKYREEINFVSRNGKSDIIILSNISSTLAEAWYNERKVSKADEAEHIIKAAAELIKNAIKNHS